MCLSWGKLRMRLLWTMARYVKETYGIFDLWYIEKEA